MEIQAVYSELSRNFKEEIRASEERIVRQLTTQVSRLQSALSLEISTKLALTQSALAQEGNVRSELINERVQDLGRQLGMGMNELINTIGEGFQEMAKQKPSSESKTFLASRSDMSHAAPESSWNFFDDDELESASQVLETQKGRVTKRNTKRKPEQRQLVDQGVAEHWAKRLKSRWFDGNSESDE